MLYNGLVRCNYIKKCKHANTNLCSICINNKVQKEYDFYREKEELSQKNRSKN